jgi:hypothetical protein
LTSELQDAKIEKNNAAQKKEDVEKKLNTQNEEVQTLKTELTTIVTTMNEGFGKIKSNVSFNEKKR